MGRRRIVIERIKDPNKRYVTFTKRRQGLFKKSDTACRMYGSQIGIIVFSPTGRLYTSGPVDSVINQFLHQSSSSSSSAYLNLKEEENVVIGDHIEDGKKRSRSGDDNDDRVTMMPEEKEAKKRKLLMSTTTEAAAAAATTEVEVEVEEEEGFLLIKNSETEEEGLVMNNGFMGFEQYVTELEEVLSGESQSSSREGTDVVDYNMGSSSTAMTASTAAASFLESDVHGDDDELEEVLNGFADYIIADHHPYEENMFDMLPHQGVYDDDQGCFTFCDNWPTIDDVVQDQLLS